MDEFMREISTHFPKLLVQFEVPIVDYPCDFPS